ncbi:hypothetical protein [Mycolicibacterium sp.]|uniref:hypothetical protein n=1 Tax=Mycolicibacterium sp. TaxID=2320850 RepID=UPI0037C5F96F
MTINAWRYADQEHTDPEGSVYGDCWRVCVANLLQLPTRKVPHFVHNHGEHWYHATKEWLLAEHQVHLLHRPPRFPITPTGRSERIILCGKSPRGDWGHAVLADHHGHVIHDPHPSRAGLETVVTAYLIATVDDLQPPTEETA